MRLLCGLLWICTAILSAAEKKPNFTGTWKVEGTDPPEIYVVNQDAFQMRIVMVIDDDAGARIVSVRGPIDGRPHSQTSDGAPCVFTARWEGDALYWETDRHPATGPLHNRRTMTLSDDQSTITVQRTRVAPAPVETWSEVWRRQDGPHLETAGLPAYFTGFGLRDMLYGKGPPLAGADGQLVRGLMASLFNDTADAERELLPLLRDPSAANHAEMVRELLFLLYERNSQVRKAAAVSTDASRSLWEARAELPELSVEQRGYARVPREPSRDGRIRIPLQAGGKDAFYLIDTGSNMSLLGDAEARRLGLTPEGPAMKIRDLGGGESEARLAIMPSLAVGPMRLRNVPFWVMDQRAMDDAGILGIDILLAFRTLRWNAETVEIGFPAERQDIRRANLCFYASDLVLKAAAGGQSLTMQIDTGNTDTSLFPAFATLFPGLLERADPRHNDFWMSGYTGRRKMREVDLPEVELGVGGFKALLNPASLVLEAPSISNSALHGTIGMDVLNRASTITIDFQAMRITLM